VDATPGTIEVAPMEGKPYLLATICIAGVRGLGNVVGRLRRLFDLDADTAAIERHLGEDERLAAAIAARPGLRVPGAWDSFELAAAPLGGGEVGAAAGTPLAGGLAAPYGGGTPAAAGGHPGLARLFPRPEALAAADLATIGMPGARARAISALAGAMAAD